MDERFARARALAATVRRTQWPQHRGFQADPNVVGSAFGRRIVNGAFTDEPAIIVYVIQKLPPGTLPASALIPRSASVGNDTIAVDVVQTGPFYAHAFTARERPAPSGISIGHIAITAGTLGALVRDNTDSGLCILSNNHVLANQNNASIGDPIVQPGPTDGGTDPADRIATLKRFIPINMAGDNRVDAAIAQVIDPNDVVDRMKNDLMPVPSPGHPAVGLLFAGSTARTLLNPIDEVLAQLNVQFLAGAGSTTPAALDMAVEKVGRTTEYTTATVTELDVTATVSYDAGPATFTGCIGTAGQLSCGGDSGSVVCQGGVGGTGEGNCGGGCPSTAAAEAILGLSLALDVSAEREFRDRYLSQTRTGAYLIDVFFRNEGRLVERARAARVSEPDRDFARQMHEKYGPAVREAMLQPERSEARVSREALQDMHEGLGRAMKHMSHEERGAAERLMRVVERTESRSMPEILQMLNDDAVYHEVVEIVSSVPFLEHP